MLERIGEIEALAAARLDPALVERLAQLPPRDGGVHFYTPTFKAYATSEISACGHSAWPAVSITGAAWSASTSIWPDCA